MINFDENVEMVTVKEVNDVRSRWGNSYCYITEEQVEKLKQGMVVWHDDGEYGTFIVLKEE